MMNTNRYCAQPPEPNNDEAFLNLLSSQRALLNQLNQESAERKARAAIVNPSDLSSSAMGNLYTCNMTNSFIVVSPNHSIRERLAVDDTVVYSKRLSLGLANNENSMLTTSSFTFGEDSFTKLGTSRGFGDATCDTDFLCGNTNKKHKQEKEEELVFDDGMPFTKKRRLSGAGLFNSLSLFVEKADQQKQFQQPCYRRFSLSSIGDHLNFPSSSMEQEEEDVFDVATSGPTTCSNFQQIPSSVPPPPVASFRTSRRAKAKKSHPEVLQGLMTGDLQETRSTLVSLSSAMEKSLKSQQDIHDWDRKMGLKRSHSKTMLQTTRSRKKLRAIVKKQINALASKKR